MWQLNSATQLPDDFTTRSILRHLSVIFGIEHLAKSYTISDSFVGYILGVLLSATDMSQSSKADYSGSS